MTNSVDMSRGIEIPSARNSKAIASANAALKTAAQFWFLTAVIGQWIFVFYILSFYGGAAIQGNFEGWNKVLPHGYEAGNMAGNFALAAHLLFAAIITIGGPLQLIPQIRSHFPAFHRWNGRVYMLTAFTMSATGLYLVLSGRTLVGDVTQHVAIGINAVLIMLCAVMALRYALDRDIKTHRRWALRLFLVVNGVWFFRIGLMLWIVIHQAPVGFDPKTFQGPFLTCLAIAVYILPITMLEVYLRAQARGDALTPYATAACLFILSVAMSIGIFAVTMRLWLPRLA